MGGFSYEPTTVVESNGVVVKIEINEEADGKVEVTNLYVNNKLQSGKEFSKSFYPAVITVTNQEDLNGTTRYTLSVDKDSDVEVKNFVVYANSDTITGGRTEVADGDKFSIAGTYNAVHLIEKVTYEYSDSNVAASCSDGTSTDQTTCEAAAATYHTWNAGGYATVTITAAELPDYFKVGTNEEDLKIFKL